MQPNAKLQPRIKEPSIIWVVAVLAFCGGVFCSLGSTPYNGAGAVAALCWALFSGCVAWGAFVLIAHKIELRLIDIQKALSRGDEAE